jgi:hypothetical protein
MARRRFSMTRGILDRHVFAQNCRCASPDC